MFSKAIIDMTTDLSPQEARFASILDFVADECVDGAFYLYKDWVTRQVNGLPTQSYFKERPRIVYIVMEEYKKSKELKKERHPVYVPNNEFICSTSSIICKGALEQQGLNATTAILTLAVAGIDIVLPNVSFDRKSKEEIFLIRDKLSEERISYLQVVTELADKSFDRLRSRDFQDIYRWAVNEATFKIQPKAELLQLRLKKLNRKLLERARTQFWKDGIPAISKALVDSGTKAAVKEVADQTIRILATTLSESIEARRLPEAAYSLRLSKFLNKR